MVELILSMLIFEYRKIRNERIRIYSNLSLYTRVGEGPAELITILPGKQGDFTKSVDFWMFIDSFPKTERNIARLLIQKESDYDVIARLRLSDEEYYTLKVKIRKRLMEYFEDEINMWEGYYE